MTDDRAALAQGIEDLGEIVDRVRSLHQRSKITFYLLGGMLVLLIGFGILAFISRAQANENQRQRESLELVVAGHKQTQERQRELINELRQTQVRQQRAANQVILEACRSRNEANRQTRAEFRRAYLNVYRLGPRTPERRAAIEDLIDGISTASEQDRDCGGGLGLGPFDYPRSRPGR